MSSTGSSNDIAAGTTGTATVSANTWNYFEITKDPIAQKYYVYVNGVLDQTISSVANICTFAGATYGVTVGSGPAAGTRNFATGYIDEFEYKSYCDHPAGTAYTPPVSANVIGTAGYASDFISLAQGITVYSVTGPSAVAGQNPPMIAINRVYHGECNASNTTIASAISYALSGRYVGPDTPAPAVATQVNFNHNLGVQFDTHGALDLVCQGNSFGYVPGEVIQNVMAFTNSAYSVNPVSILGRNSGGVLTGANGLLIQTKPTGSEQSIVSTSVWLMRPTFKRGW
jgi:hypothetical protein